MSEAPDRQPEPPVERGFPLWAARRWYLYRLHRGASMLALGSTLLTLSALIPLAPIDLGAVGSARARITTIAAGVCWIAAIITIARATRLLITGTPGHRHSATRLALGVAIPPLGALGAAGAGVALVAFIAGDNALGGLWTGVASIIALVVLAVALWACAAVASDAPQGGHARTVWVRVSVNAAVLLVLVTLCVIVLSLMGVLGIVGAWIAAIALALIAFLSTLAALSARAVLGAIILAREVAELGPEIEPVSGP